MDLKLQRNAFYLGLFVKLVSVNFLVACDPDATAGLTSKEDIPAAEGPELVAPVRGEGTEVIIEEKARLLVAPGYTVQRFDFLSGYSESLQEKTGRTSLHMALHSVSPRDVQLGYGTLLKKMNLDIAGERSTSDFLYGPGIVSVLKPGFEVRVLGLPEGGPLPFRWLTVSRRQLLAPDESGRQEIIGEVDIVAGAVWFVDATQQTKLLRVVLVSHDKLTSDLDFEAARQFLRRLNEQKFQWLPRN